MIDEFGSLAGVIATSRAEQERIVPEAAALDHLACLRDALSHAARTKARGGPVFGTARDLLDFLILDQGHEPAERVRVIFVSGKNEMIRDITVGHGSVDAAWFSISAVIRIALDSGAAGLLIVHNHPSGDPEPSAQDIRVTQDLAQAAKLFDLALHDHLIVSRRGWTSFRAKGLL